MGRILSIIVSAAILLGAPLATAQLGYTGAPASGAIAPAQPPYIYPEVFPVELPGLGFAMPKQAFLNVIAARNLTPTTNSSKSMFLVQPPGAPYGSVVYFFDSNAGPILNEMELRFPDEASAKAYFRVKAWRFKSKVFIVATMPNTRWASQN